MPAAAKILVIDDSAATREVCSALLTERGYEVATAEDGFIALLYLAKTFLT